MTANTWLSGANQFFDEHMETLRLQLRRRLACDEDARDLAQEACLKFLLEWRRRDDIRNPQAYLHRIAHNLLYRHYANRGRAAVDAEISVDLLPTDGPELEVCLHDMQRVERIQRVWRELSPKCQRALRLRWQEGLSIVEIAECMGLSQGMVKKYLAQGLAHCRKRLGRTIEAERVAA